MGRVEDEVLERIERDKARGDEIDDEMRYDPVTRTLRHGRRSRDPDGSTDMQPEDATLYSAEVDSRIIIPAELVRPTREGSRKVMFHCWDKGDVYTLLGDGYSEGSVPGTLNFLNDHENIPDSTLNKPEDKVRIIIRKSALNSGGHMPVSSTGVVGYVLHGTEWKQVVVETIPIKSELFSRNGGLLETDVLSTKRVLVVGLGSGGSRIAMDLAKSGVMQLYLIDYDRLEVGNVSRHVLGLPHVGRCKTKAMIHSLKEKNPYIEIETSEQKVSWENREELRKIVQKADIVVCATDNRDSRRVINKTCVEENKPCIYGGVFRRAYGGQILFVHPRESLCYECFGMLLPEQATDEEISNPEQAAEISYSDRPVAVEPGLDTDIAPISLMIVKLVIQELLKGTETTLRSLDEDLIAPLYLWLNRREAGTQYEKLRPLKFHVDGLHILRWYGVDIKRHPACPVCGDFEGELAKQKRGQFEDTDQAINGLKG